MNNPKIILETLERHLTNEMRLVIYGRAALSLGYEQPPIECAATMDVDAILPTVEMKQIEANDDFWDAIEATNTELQESGLYITHLFSDEQVILTPAWLDRICKIDYPLKNLKLYRPHTHDLILTKMMRVDPQDRSDILFLLTQADCNPHNLLQDLNLAKLPPIQEIKEAFDKNITWLQSQLY